ncbi:NADH-quinone oxidoreductase subunit N [Prauserella shujinwangii]|uniref:NADH-quinone oxidoreductase subunit N n=1 Tax=Prauserella shujinwangii TaxID=1453103 RepID=A0A2T0LR50_9PSEU|nr:proton-conducting transporter membrane subunit [Prauserella shujinwangii]PRX45967.1 NADH-quinone oxidoreductase subunit N [Prauserella shujinwangii]
MSTSMSRDLLRVLPEMLVAAAAVLGLLLGSFLPRHRQWVVRALAAAAVAAALAVAVARWPAGGTPAFDGVYTVDVALAGTRVIVLGALLLVFALAAGEVRGAARETEFVVLTLLGGLGAVLLAGAADTMLLAAAYLLASVPLYALAAFAKDAPGTEGALKYYLLGALLGVTLLFGVMVLFGGGGATAYRVLAESLPRGPGAAVAVGVLALFAGLLFKAGAVPAHFWVPDVTEGARPPVGALVTTVPKIGAVVAIHRFAGTVLAPTDLDWPLVVAIIAAATMTLGNLAAFFQDSVRRLLAYSTISQVGYVLLAVAAATRSDLALPALLLYLAAYAVTNLGAFAVVCALPETRTLADYTGLRRRYPWLALALVVLLLGLVGTPPTAVFAGKLTVFTAALDAGFGWLVVLAVVNTVASVFYYLRWIVPAVRSGDFAGRPAPQAGAVALAAAPVTIAVGLLAGPLLAAFDGPLLPS